MRSIVSAVAGLVLLGSPLVASAHPFVRGFVGYRAPVVVAPAPVVVAPAPVPVFAGPRVFVGPGYWHHPHFFYGRYGWRR